MAVYKYHNYHLQYLDILLSFWYPMYVYIALLLCFGLGRVNVKEESFRKIIIGFWEKTQGSEKFGTRMEKLDIEGVGGLKMGTIINLQKTRDNWVDHLLYLLYYQRRPK